MESRTVDAKTMKHPNDMTWQELRDLVSAMGWAALDLAQNLNFIDTMLKHEYRDQAFKSAIKQAYTLSEMPYCEDELEESNTDVSVFGPNGIEKPFSFFNKKT